MPFEQAKSEGTGTTCYRDGMTSMNHGAQSNQLARRSVHASFPANSTHSLLPLPSLYAAPESSRFCTPAVAKTNVVAAGGKLLDLLLRLSMRRLLPEILLAQNLNNRHRHTMTQQQSLVITKSWRMHDVHTHSRFFTKYRLDIHHPIETLFSASAGRHALSTRSFV